MRAHVVVDAGVVTATDEFIVVFERAAPLLVTTAALASGVISGCSSRDDDDKWWVTYCYGAAPHARTGSFCGAHVVTASA